MIWLWYLRCVVVAYFVVVVLAARRLAAADDLWVSLFIILSVAATSGIWLVGEIYHMTHRRRVL